MAKVDERPDPLDLIRWLDRLPDPVEQLVQATKLGDAVKDQLLIELAARRRTSAVQARRKLMDEGMTASDATRHLASLVGQSPQTIARLIWERKEYGYDGGI